MLDITTILISIVPLLFYLFLKYRNKKTGFPPPGPKGYPIIGNLFQLDHISLSELSKTYGDIYSINIFGLKGVVLNSSDIIREALLKEPNASIFASRRKSFFGENFMYNYSDIVFCSNTETWTKRRKFSHKLLKAYGEGLKTIEKRLHHKLGGIISDVNKYKGLVFDPEDVITDFLVGIITGLLTGKEYDRNHQFSNTILEYDAAVNKMLDPKISVALRLFPWLQYLPGKLKELTDQCRKVQNKFIEQVKKEKNICEGGMIQDFYEALSSSDKSKHIDWLTEESILAILFDMILGGILTSKGTLWSMIRILISRPDVQHKVQDEVDRVVRLDRLPSLSDKSSMPYTEAVIYETLRLISHLPISVPHVNSEDAKLGGYDIEKGSIIFINIWNVHLGGKVFEDPYNFCPERFLGEDGYMAPADTPVRQGFLAFGVGKRACIGEIFARNRIFLFLASMMQHFTFESEDGHIPDMLDPRDMVPFAIRMPRRYKCKAIKRSK